MKSQSQKSKSIEEKLHGRPLVAILAVTLAVVGASKAIIVWWWQTFSDGDLVIYNEGSLGLGAVAFFVLGFAIYFLLIRNSSGWSKEDSIYSGLGVIIVIFLTKILGAGASFVDAVIGVLYISPALVFTFFGAAIAQQLNSKYSR